MTKSCFQQKTELHNAKAKWNCSAKTLHCKHQHKEWNLTQSVEAQAMFIKCFWNILWWVIEVENYIKSTEHKSDYFQTVVCPPPPIRIPHKHLRVFHPFGLLILHCGPASPAWHNSSLVFPMKILNYFLSQLLIAYTYLCVWFLLQILIAFGNQLLPGY